MILFLFLALPLAVVGAEEEGPTDPASEKYGNEPLVIVGTAAVARTGVAATLTCKFEKLEGQMEILWTDTDGAKVGVYGYASKDAYTQQTEDFDEATNSQEGILIIHANKVVSTTSFKCEVGAGAVDSRRLPPPTKLELRVYDIKGYSRVAIKDTDVTLKCSFVFVTTKPVEVFWKVNNIKRCSKIQSDPAAPTCSDGEIDDPESRDPDHVYWIDEEDSGYEMFTPTSRALASTLTVAGKGNSVDRDYTCGIKLPDEGEWTLPLSVDVFSVSRTYKDVRSYTEVKLSCLFKEMQNELAVYWSQGKGGEKLTAEKSGNFIVLTTFDAYQKRQRSTLTIPKLFNEFSADYFCSVYDIDTYRDTKVSLGVFHVTTTPQTVQAGVTVTLSCSLSSLSYPVRVQWRNPNGMVFDELAQGNYVVDDDERDETSNTQTPTLVIPGSYNTGSITFTCVITPDPCVIGYTQHENYQQPGAGAEDDGAEGDGGADSGGADSGGADSGGADSGGADSGGADSGGADSGGADSGGADSGGADSGGADSGGADSGGADSGGADSGGADSGGADSGGADSGGADSGGADPVEVCSVTVAADGTPREIVPGVVDVVLHELLNTGTQCSIETFRSLRKESFDTHQGNIPKPCFSIMEVGSGSKYAVYSAQTYVSPGNNLEVKPLPIFKAAFGEDTVYRCTETGWSKNPPGCGSGQMKSSVPVGACSTQKLFHPEYYKVVSGFEVPDPDYSHSSHPDVYFTHVEKGTVVEYSIRNSDCYKFEFSEDHLTEHADANGTVTRTTFTTTCVDGVFTPAIIPAKKVCCKFPTIKLDGEPEATFCVQAVGETSNLHGPSEGMDILTGQKYFKNGRRVHFDKRCPCYSITWDNVTCHEGKILSTTWDIPAEFRPDDPDRLVNINGREQLVLESEFSLEKFCCKIPQNQADEGHPVNDLSSVRYLYRGKTITYTCTGHCYRIKQKLRKATCSVTTPVLESPKCEPDPTCCTELEERNPFVKELGNITWPKTTNGKKHELKVGDMTITRRCYYSEWDLIRYKDVVTNDLALQWKINGTDEICGNKLPGSDFTYSSKTDETQENKDASGNGDNPDGDVSDGDVPDGDVPDGDVPDGDVPDGDVPDGDVPDGDVPDGDVPDGDVPDGDVPDGDVPDGDVPDGDVPDGNVPDGNVPDGDVPEGDVPEGDVPDDANESESSQDGANGNEPSGNRKRSVSKRDTADNSANTDNSVSVDTNEDAEDTEDTQDTQDTMCIPAENTTDALLGLKDENCVTLEHMLSVNLSKEYTLAALDRLHEYSFNITEKTEKSTCYNALRYVLLDPWNFGYASHLDSNYRNRLIVSTANIINTWVSLVSENFKRAFSYVAIKVKKEAAAMSSSVHLYDGWMIDMKANNYVQTSFMWTMQNLLFPSTTQSDIISPIAWVDLPHNSTIPGETQYITVNFTSSKPLNKMRHYACGVFHLGEWKNEKLVEAESPDWSRGSCDHVTTEHDYQSVICQCSSWKMFLAVTQTRNYTSGLWGNFTVGTAATPMLLHAYDILDIGAMVPLAVVFILLVKASTRRQPLMQCRMQICVGMVGSHLLSLLTTYMLPANISCVYMVYLMEIFVLATLLWFSVEFFCLRNVILGMKHPDMKPSKKYSFKMIPVVYIVAFLIPSAFILYFRLTSTAVKFVQPFDAQTCWFNQDLEIFLFTTPVFAFILLGICMYVVPVVTCFMSEKRCGIDVVSSGIMFLNVVISWTLNSFRAHPYIEYTSRALLAVQGVLGLLCYIWLTPDVKTSLFPGCFPTDDGDEDNQKLVGH